MTWITIITFFYLGLLNKIFNKSNIRKILIIFIVGFFSRMFLNYIYNVKIFVDFFYKISIIYYLFFFIFVVLVHEVIDYFYMILDINPSFKSNIKIKIPLISEMIPDNEHVSKTKAFSSSSNNSSKINSSSSSIEPIDRFLWEEEVKRLREPREEASSRRRRETFDKAILSVIKWYEATRLKREEKLASDLRWEEEKKMYPHLSHRSRLLRIDGPRKRDNLLRSSNNILPSISNLPVLSSLYDASTLSRSLDLPSINNSESRPNNNDMEPLTSKGSNDCTDNDQNNTNNNIRNNN